MLFFFFTELIQWFHSRRSKITATTWGEFLIIVDAGLTHTPTYICVCVCVCVCVCPLQFIGSISSVFSLQHVHSLTIWHWSEAGYSLILWPERGDTLIRMIYCISPFQPHYTHMYTHTHLINWTTSTDSEAQHDKHRSRCSAHITNRCTMVRCRCFQMISLVMTLKGQSTTKPRG